MTSRHDPAAGMTEMSRPAHATAAGKTFGRDRLVLMCDWLAVALAASLPWSTSATGILVGLALGANPHA